MYRAMLRREIQKVARGLDLMNFFRDPNDAIIDTKLDESLRKSRLGHVSFTSETVIGNAASRP